MVDKIEARIFELVEPYNGRSWLTFNKPVLTGDSALNHTMRMDEQEAMELLDEIFTEFHLEHDALDFSTYFPATKAQSKPLTINMLIESAKAGRWLYD
ncbi:Protein of uncharacterised function (DUF1493) [Serratia rubidaea]|uniref:Protein of uncharacterized function (DUF1493) n=2 Tax=Serratia rubidaea TaxID=61652 RepID=A0A447QF51_SERRU|nr:MULTISPECIES: DUF1493 family protein [Serratia]AGB83250.1 Protein of unknown function (DUF1493) [Serratia sp. FGI94]MBS0972776.1 DUF1493 family protein [Serratia rubidaea]MDC6110080.1 DUF1493 family protein [Serratia rubidaea]MEB7585318.1 DUF1493 family protein [Serratia rubidaea]QPR63531.1 DUF1493 family protein [Serratia rubidaea]